MSHLCLENNFPTTTHATEKVIHTLCRIIEYNNDVGILTKTALSLEYLSSDDNCEIFVDHGALPYLIRLLRHTESKIKKSVLRVFRNITDECNEQQKQALIDSELLLVINENLNDSKPENQALAGRIISNITFHANMEQAEKIIEVGVVASLCKLFKKQNEKFITVSSLHIAAYYSHIKPLS